MRAAVYRQYGPPEVIRIEDLEKPTPRDHEIQVRVRAATVGTWDCESRSFSFPAWFWLPLRLAMGIRKPRWPVLGQEFAGEVEAVGKKVTRFEPGDRVFASVGLGFGAHAEYICLSSRRAVAHMPRNLSYAEAACIPTGGDNALHFLRMAEVQPGERVLVNGAGGNIGAMGRWLGARAAVDRRHAEGQLDPDATVLEQLDPVLAPAVAPDDAHDVVLDDVAHRDLGSGRCDRVAREGERAHVGGVDHQDHAAAVCVAIDLPVAEDRIAAAGQRDPCDERNGDGNGDGTAGPGSPAHALSRPRA